MNTTFKLLNPNSTPLKIVDFAEPSEKITILVKALRLVSSDEDIRERKLLIPDGCEHQGFIEGSHKLGELLHFLADMLEE